VTQNVTHLALLRGINVGGKNALAMKDLARMFADAGCTEVRTFIQSGNVVFRPPAKAPKLSEAIAAKIDKRFGYRVPVILRTSQQMARIVRDNPFLQAGLAEKTLHVYFLADAPDARAIAGLDPGRSAPDAFSSSRPGDLLAPSQRHGAH
jgi:uncharacterized protein (DUF1697 family)